MCGKTMRDAKPRIRAWHLHEHHDAKPTESVWNGFEGRPGVSAMTLRTLRPVDWHAKRPAQKGGGAGC